MFPAHAGMIPLPQALVLTCHMFPAHAGMIPQAAIDVQTLSNVPRTRGDDPEYKGLKESQAKCSPHTRG